jgi:hypothetical protein
VQGNLSEFSLAHLLQFFALSERSGTITVRTADRESRLFIENDRIIGWGLPNWDARGALLACELLPPQTVESLCRLQPRHDTPGLSFIVRNLVDPERWDLFVQRCLEQDVYPLLTAEHGEFEVHVQRCPPAPLRLSLQVSALILDGSRWESEIEAAAIDGINGASSWQCTGPTSLPPRVQLTGLDLLVWKIMREPQTIGGVAQRIGSPVLATITAIRRMHGLGLLSPVSTQFDELPEDRSNDTACEQHWDTRT